MAPDAAARLLHSITLILEILPWADVAVLPLADAPRSAYRTSAAREAPEALSAWFLAKKGGSDDA